MKRMLALLLFLFACPTDPDGGDTARLRLVRQPAGRVAVEISGAPASPRALQMEIAIDGTGVVIEDVAAPEGRPLDTIRGAMAGANSARLFAGDKRGILLARDGAALTFAVRADSGASIRIDSAMLVDDAGNAIPVDLGGSLVVR